MATWEEFSAEAPELAAAARRGFQAARHHVLATLRRDGSPRVSGTEVDFRGPDLALGSMGGARKAADLRRDGASVVMTRAGALSFSRWRRSLSRNGARWLTAQVSSMPSFVSCRVPYIAPTLLTSTSSFG